MKDKWLDRLHDKMEHYEMDAPSGLWESICAATEGEMDGRRGRSRLSLLSLWSGAAASVVVIIASVCYLAFSGKMEEATGILVSENMPLNINKGGQKPLVENRLLADGADIKEEMERVFAEDVDKCNEKESHEKNRQDDVVGDVVKSDEGPVVDDGYPDVSTGGDDAVEIDESNADRHILDTDMSGDDFIVRGKKEIYNNIGRDAGRYSLGAYASGGFNSSFSHTTIGNAGIIATGVDKSGWKDTPMLGIMLYNQGRDVTTRVKHHQPVRVGLSFGYRLNDRLSVETGLTYTSLRSDMREGSENHYFYGEQNLNYLGIPVALHFDFLRWKRLSLYMSGGVLAEKNISGSVKRNYILDNSIEKVEKDRIIERQLQISANVSAGVQLDLINSIGVFAEPGVSYYFDNGSSINSVYKDKPFNFNLNLGLRFTL